MILFIISILIYQYTYITIVIPPQMGWWNYYGWRINEGNFLYKDIYCFIQPYYIWFMALLYRFFDINLFYYQILGVFFRLLETLIVYLILRKNFSKIVSIFCSYIGLILTTTYLMDIPLDYNQIVRILTELSALIGILVINCKDIKAQKKLLLFLGIVCGILFMIKQTGIIFFFGILLGVFIIYYKLENIRQACNKIIFLLIGFLISVLPGYIYLILTNSFDPYLTCIIDSSSVKGSIKDMFFTRIIQYQISWQEIVLSILLICYLINFKVKLREDYKAFYSIPYTVIYLCIITKIDNINMKCTGSYLELKTKIAITFIFITIVFIHFIEKKYNYKIEEILNKRRFKLHPIFLISILIITLFCYNIAFEERKEYYSTMILSNYIRGVVNIIFWTVLGLFIIQTWQLFKKKKISLGLSYYIFLSIELCYLVLGIMSSVIEEIYMFAIAAVILATIVVKINRSQLVEKIILGILSLVLICTAITQKQVQAYSWHGWSCIGLNNPMIMYEQVHIDGLKGYILDKDTNKAYEKIISIINKNTNKEDVVYQFPHIPLFNVLTKRKIGTYAVVHYFDVCPDNIAVQDARYLWKQPPKIVIWCEFGEGLWDFHETYFRSGKPSGQKKIREFYNTYVKNYYKKEYEYKSISIWVRE